MIILNWLFRKYSIFEFGRKILMSLLPFFLQIVSIKRYNFWHYSRYLTDQITCHFFKQVWKSGSHMQLRNVTLKSKPGPWKRLNVFLRQIASFFTCDQSVWHLNKALCQDFFGFYIFYLKQGYYSEAFFCTDNILMIPKFRFKFIIYIHVHYNLKKMISCTFRFFFYTYRLSDQKQTVTKMAALYVI